MLKKVLRARPYRVLISTGIWVGAFCMMPSCSDDYEWAQEKPSWLGQSIYDELARRGNFGIYLKMVDDLGRTEFLSKTGSVTVFEPMTILIALILRRREWMRIISPPR